MSNSEKYSKVTGFLTPPPKWRSNRCVPVMPRSERKPWRSGYGQQAKTDLFHVIHKVPAGDSPYVKAKHVQMIDKDPSRAVSLFWAAINAGDRVDSALKDMAVVMKQLNRSDEAIEAIKSFRHLCPLESQESLDNVLIELYKRSRRIEEEIQMLKLKIKNIEDGIAFDGKRTKMARSQGKKVQITIEKEYSRLLGNLAWAHLQLEDYKSAAENYRKALSLEPDKNKHCNLAICLIHLNKTAEAKFLLESVRASCINEQMEESYVRSFERAAQILEDLEMQNNGEPVAWEDGFYGEVQTHFPSGARRKLKGFSGEDNAGQCDLPGAEKSNVSANVHHNQIVPLHELTGGAGFWKHNESSPGLPGRGNVKGTNGGSRRNENQFGNGQVSLYASPGCLAGPPEDPFTQPRKCLWPFNGDQRRNWHAEDAIGGYNKKLSFEQHKDCANSQFVAIHNHARFLSVSANTDSKSEGTKVSTSENWRKNIPEDHANINSENNGDCERNILESDEQHNAAKDECEEKHNLPSGLSVNSVRMRVKQFSNLDCEQSYTSITAGNTELTDAAKNDSQNQKSSQQLTTYLKEFQEFSESKKSWADMVEEDEQQLQSGTDDFPDHAWAFLADKPFLSCRSPSKFSDQLKGREDFSDENYNTNIIPQTPAPLNQSQNLSQKFKSLGVKDDYYTQPHHDKVSLNEHQKSNIPANCFSSPLPKRSLDFECENSMSLEQDHATSNGLKLMRRNRLQVFRNITPESPRC